MRMATVVLPVPGLPVKHMCSEGFAPATPSAARALSTTSSEAISRMRVFTGTRPTSSRSSSSSTAPTPDSASSALQVDRSLMAVHARSALRRARACSARAGRRLPRGAACSAPRLLRAVHHERQAHGLEAARRVEGVQLDVAVGVRLAALAELRHARRPRPSGRTSACPTSPSRCCADAGRRCTRARRPSPAPSA